ncbi:hypothetical protein CR513_42084, partial [Mucuna pruriens]
MASGDNLPPPAPPLNPTPNFGTGLPEEYDSLINLVNSRYEPFDLDELEALLFAQFYVISHAVDQHDSGEKIRLIRGCQILAPSIQLTNCQVDDYEPDLTFESLSSKMEIENKS